MKRETKLERLIKYSNRNKPYKEEKLDVNIVRSYYKVYGKRLNIIKRTKRMVNRFYEYSRTTKLFSRNTFL